MKIWRMRSASWIIKATNTHSEYVTLFFFHSNNGCTNAPQIYVIHTLPVLLRHRIEPNSNFRAFPDNAVLHDICGAVVA
jgi:hypothetical protein